MFALFLNDMGRETPTDSWIKAFVILVSAAGLSSGQPAPPPVVDFGSDWSVRWNEVRLDPVSTQYAVVRENGKSVLRAQSDDSASALWLALEESVSEQTRLTWRWKVTRGLTNNRKEREKGGDDYAVGSIYTSPYSSDVITIVLESGSRRNGEWITESRNVEEDYRRTFGTQPDTIHAVAVMVDTDNTKSSATAWFSDITLLP